MPECRFLAECGIMCIEINDFAECEIVSLATGCEIVSAVDQLNQVKFGNAGNQ